MHTHLAAGAAELCQGPVAMAQLETNRDSAEIPAHLTDVKAPLDYAPKTSPDEKGMLNESFGLENENPAVVAQEKAAAQ